MSPRQFVRLVFILVCSAFLCACLEKREPVSCIPPAGKYDARILRDTWGVPHVFGVTDADAAYGLAWAECEDDWKNVEDAILLARARLGSVRGREAAKFDYLMRLFRVREFVEAKYETDLSPDVRAICEAFADGINHFASVHPEKMPDIPLPVTGKDIVAGATFKAPFFYELHAHIQRLLEGEGGVPIGEKGQMGCADPPASPYTEPGQAMGSNAFAVGPSRSADGATRLAVNSHQPWTGPVTWYEAHVHSEQGWDMTGGTFPCAPMIFSGHDENKGWCHTINRPDLVDIYELRMNPENENQYWFDGAWKDLERDTAKLRVKLWGRLKINVKRELLWSVHGPAFRTKRGVFALRFAGYGEIRHVEQWFRMNKARNLDEFKAAMRTMGLTSLNMLYADKEGNLFYAYMGHFPKGRMPGMDWKACLPGDRSDLLTEGHLSFEEIPQVLNPPSGFIQSCNNSPFHTTTGPGNPLPEAFAPELGIETSMTNRALRALELYGGDDSITADEFYAYKYDKTYSDQSDMAQFIAAVCTAPAPEDELTRNAVVLLLTWDRATTKENTGAALAVKAFMPYRTAKRHGQQADAVECLRSAAQSLEQTFGRLDPPWADVMRLRRGTLDLGLGGGPDCLRAVDPEMDEDGRYKAINGDCFFEIVTWAKDGRVSAESIHQFGSATLDETSPHYADQSPLFAEERLKPVWTAESDIRANLEREYRPGE